MNEATIEQPKPTGNGADITDLVVADHLERRNVGVSRYGQPLRAFNGRNSLVDAYQECLDLVVYLRQKIEESNGRVFHGIDIKTTSEIAVDLIQSTGGDHMVVAAAKVSTSGTAAIEFAKPENAEANAGLINYLMQHRHGTPFEHSSLTFFVHAPIFVWREWHRHRIGFCLAGDTRITTGSWTRTRTISEIYRNWYEGVPDSRPFRAAEGVSFDQQTGKWRAQARRDGKTISLGRYTDRADALAVRNQWEDENPTFRTRLLPSCRGLKARVLNEDTQLFTVGRMADVYQSGIKQLYLVRTVKGHELKASADHRVLTEDGWAAISELRAGDRIAVVGKRSKFAERQLPPSLRAGIGVWTSMQRNTLIRESDRCYICGQKLPREALVLDHIVPVVTDLCQALNTANLKPACEACHRIKTNGEQILARRANVSGSRYIKLASTPVCIGEDMTYDIAMEDPWHNFVANGIVVHNSYNEESARYKQLDPLFWIPPKDRKIVPDSGHTSARPKFKRGNDGEYAMLCDVLKDSYKQAYMSYQCLLDAGFAKEVARACLPVAIYSACWVTCNPRSLMAFLSLRTHDEQAKFVSYPQAEIECAARAVEKIFATGWPLTYAAFIKNGRVAP